MPEPFVAVLMGSDSDLPVLQGTLDVLKTLEIPFEVRITSAHRTPQATHHYVQDADRRGCACFIAAAGLAAHLAGTVAGLTLKPVIGIPLDAGPLKGIDSLLSTVQMPGGIPVACVAIGRAGAKNAAYLAAQILAVSDADLAQRLQQERETNAREVMAKDTALQQRLKVAYDWRLKRAARLLRLGGIVAYPTEAVYGLGCDPQDCDAVHRLLRLKGRRVGKGLILIAAEFAQIERFLAPVGPVIMQRVLTTWPGPVTWLWPARTDCPPWLSGAYDTLAVRVTAHPLSAALCREAGMALVSTSANRSGHPPARTTLAVRRSFESALDYVLPGHVGGLAKPTEIRTALTGAVMRAG